MKMNIGLINVDSLYPNLALMKIAAYLCSIPFPEIVSELADWLRGKGPIPNGKEPQK